MSDTSSMNAIESPAEMEAMSYDKLLGYLEGEFKLSYLNQLDALDKKYNKKTHAHMVQCVGTSRFLPYTKEYLRRNKLNVVNGNVYHDLSDIRIFADVFKRPYTIETPNSEMIIVNFISFPENTVA